GLNRSHARALLEKGLIEEQQLAPALASQQPDTILREHPLTLGDEQASALASVNFDRFEVSLLDGATGSGKTEVYLQAIAKVLEAGRQALVLVPEIGLTPHTLARFQRRFALPIV